jgi:hypothetical protein
MNNEYHESLPLPNPQGKKKEMKDSARKKNSVAVETELKTEQFVTMYQ